MDLKTVAMVVAASSHAFSVAQTVTARPLRVLDLRAAITAATHRDDFTVDAVAQSHGRWAALGNFESTRESVIAAGDDSGSIRVSDLIRPTADRIAMDANGLIHLRLRQSQHDVSEIALADHSTLRTVARYKVAEGGLEPVNSGSEVLWRRRDTLFRIHPSFWPMGTLSQPVRPPAPTPELAAEPVLIFALPSGRWVQFGILSEDISVFEADGTPAGAVRAALDDAYRGTNAKGLKYRPTSGNARTLWAAGTRDGRLYVCLAGLPVIGPAYIAAIDPLTGRLIKLIAAETPTTPERVAEYDGTGAIYPIDGAVDDRIAILDGKVRILAIYAAE